MCTNSFVAAHQEEYMQRVECDALHLRQRLRLLTFAATSAVAVGLNGLALRKAATADHLVLRGVRRLNEP